MRKLKSILFLLLLFVYQPLAAEQAEHDEALQALAAKFFQWRKIQQPVSGDDIPRVERPHGWVPDFSPQALLDYQTGYESFMQALEQLDQDSWTLADQVDARLLRAAIERVHWELNVLRAPHRNPLFYVHQTLGSVFELLVLSSPITAKRAENILLRLEHIPQTLDAARDNLSQPVRPFAQATIDMLADVDERLQALQIALQSEFPAELDKRLEKSIKRANKALQAYSKWLSSNLDSMRTAFALGPHAYQWFLSHVALIPFTPDELLAQGRLAWSQSVVLDVLENNRNRELPELSVFDNADHQIRASELKEKEIRSFLESRDLMTVPDWLMHYRSRPMPAYLAP
jgi:hypothetical protein